MIVVSYYTKHTGYEQEAKNLIASCKKFDLQTDIVGIASKGSWDTNCCYKPSFLIEKLREHQNSIVWMDADAVFIQKPILFEMLDCDIALRIVDDLPIGHPSKIITGTLFLQCRPKVFELLKRWDTECREMHKKGGEVWDQIALQRVLVKSPLIKLFPLPDEYYLIYDQAANQSKKGVIVHYQASRLLKKVVNREVICFWEKGMFAQEKRRRFSDLM